MTDGDNNATTIEHDAVGHPTAIVAPGGQRTTLSVAAGGYLAAIANPMGDTVTLTSTATGLLTALTDPNGNSHTFGYDEQGRLTRDTDPAGGSAYAGVEGGALVSFTSGGFSVCAEAGLGVGSSLEVSGDGLARTGTEAFAEGKLKVGKLAALGAKLALDSCGDAKWKVKGELLDGGDYGASFTAKGNLFDEGGHWDPTTNAKLGDLGLKESVKVYNGENEWKNPWKDEAKDKSWSFETQGKVGAKGCWQFLF